LEGGGVGCDTSGRDQYVCEGHNGTADPSYGLEQSKHSNISSYVDTAERDVREQF